MKNISRKGRGQGYVIWFRILYLVEYFRNG